MRCGCGLVERSLSRVTTNNYDGKVNKLSDRRAAINSKREGVRINDDCKFIITFNLDLMMEACQSTYIGINVDGRCRQSFPSYFDSKLIELFELETTF